MEELGRESQLAPLPYGLGFQNPSGRLPGLGRGQ